MKIEELIYSKNFDRERANKLQDFVAKLKELKNIMVSYKVQGHL